MGVDAGAAGMGPAWGGASAAQPLTVAKSLQAPSRQPPPGSWPRASVLPLLGRAVAAMSGGRGELTTLLGAGLDATEAEALL